MDWYFVGADFGESRDYSAVAVIERAELKGDFDPAVWAYEKKAALRLRYLERIALGTPYPEVVERVLQVTNGSKLADRCHLAVDGTGVGRAVVDLLRRGRPRGTLLPVTITAGQSETYDQGFYRVPKRDLIIGLQVVLQRRGVQIAAGGAHDDLVFAVALAYWSAARAFPEDARGTARWWSREDGLGLGRLV